MMNDDQDIITKLEKLSNLHSDGHLNSEEFTLAKKKLLSNDSQDCRTNSDADRSSQMPKSLPKEFQRFSNNDDVGKAANRYVSLQIVMSIIGVIIFCIFAVSMCSERKKFRKDFNSFPSLPSNR